MTLDLTDHDHKLIQDALHIFASYAPTEANENEIIELGRRIVAARNTPPRDASSRAAIRATISRVKKLARSRQLTPQMLDELTEQLIAETTRDEVGSEG